MNKGLRTTLLLVLLAVMLLAAPLQTMAATVKPGETVTATISFSSAKPVISAQADYSLSSGLTFVSTTASGVSILGKASATRAIGLDLSGTGVSSGSFTVTATVNADAKGDQTITFSGVTGAFSSSEKGSVAGGKTVTFTVEAPEPDVVWSEWAVRTAATCDAEGLEFRTSDKGVEETRPIPKKEHDWDIWKTVTAAACDKDGLEERVCKTFATHKETRPIKAPGHDWGPWVEKTVATCTAKGLEERVCKTNGAHKETRDIAMLAHVEGPWVVIREATEEEDGLRVKYCTVGKEVLKEEVIPFRTAAYYYNNTASTEGLRFRDVNPELTKKWYMFTPVDLSQDGEQVIPVIASNLYYIGNVVVKVSEGSVTIEPKLLKAVKVKSQFVTIFPALDAVTAVEPADIGQSLPFNEPVNLAELLGEDTNALLYAHFVVDYNDEISGVRVFRHTSNEYKQLVETLTGMMD